MTFFSLPLPPSTNHAYKLGMRGGQARMMKTPEMAAWQQGVALVVGAWQPPERTPLRVTIFLYIPDKLFRRTDIDGYVKLLVDAVIGSRRDQYVDCLMVYKHHGDGRAVVYIEALEQARPVVVKAKGEA